jgi:hypothetical protein
MKFKFLTTAPALLFALGLSNYKEHNMNHKTYPRSANLNLTNQVKSTFISFAFAIAMAGLLISQSASATLLTIGTSGTSPDGAGAFDLTGLSSVGNAASGLDVQTGFTGTGTFTSETLSHLINGGSIGQNTTTADYFIRYWDYVFTLPVGWDPASISIMGQFVGDDGVAFYVNGSSTAALSYGTGNSNTFQSNNPWATTQAWSLSSADGLTTGINTLKIVTPDINSYGQLGNDFLTVQGTPAPVPEPSTVFLLGFGVLAALFGRGYRHRKHG